MLTSLQIDYNALASHLGIQYSKNARASCKKLFSKIKNIGLNGAAGEEAENEEDGPPKKKAKTEAKKPAPKKTVKKSAASKTSKKITNEADGESDAESQGEDGELDDLMENGDEVTIEIPSLDVHNPHYELLASKLRGNEVGGGPMVKNDQEKPVPQKKTATKKYTHRFQTNYIRLK